MTARPPRAGQADFCQFCGCGGSYPNCPTREAAETCPWWSAGDRHAFDLIQAGIARRRLEAAASAMRGALLAASQALRSYQHGNASPDLAKAIADACDAALALADPARPQDDEVRP